MPDTPGAASLVEFARPNPNGQIVLLRTSSTLESVDSRALVLARGTVRHQPSQRNVRLSTRTKGDRNQDSDSNSPMRLYSVARAIQHSTTRILGNGRCA